MRIKRPSCGRHLRTTARPVHVAGDSPNIPHNINLILCPFPEIPLIWICVWVLEGGDSKEQIRAAYPDFTFSRPGLNIK